jgi:chaperonin GroEL (HSP60 family)
VGDEAVGLGILRRALEAPIRQIADNAGAHMKSSSSTSRGSSPASATTRSRVSTATSSRRASSMPPR